MVRAGGLEPPRAKPYGFSYPYGFRRDHQTVILWSGLSLHPSNALGAARLVSTPSLLGAWLGIAMSHKDLEVSPNLGSSTLRISPKALNL